MTEGNVVQAANDSFSRFPQGRSVDGLRHVGGKSKVHFRAILAQNGPKWSQNLVLGPNLRLGVLAPWVTLPGALGAWPNVS